MSGAVGRLGVLGLLGLLGRLRRLRALGRLRAVGLLGFVAGGLAVLAVGCSKVSPEQAASLAAEGYYGHLARGEYQQFFEGRVGADSLPAGYREQLLAGYEQFVAQQQRAHQGIHRVSVSNAQRDTLTGTVNVFLILAYGDSISEEIVVPMVERGGRWLMK